MPHTGLFNHGQEIQTEALPKRLDIAPPRRDPPKARGPDGGAMAKARAANGETASAEARAKMNASHTGLRHSEETRAKITAANYRRWNTQPATPAPAARETHSIEPDIIDADMTAADTSTLAVSCVKRGHAPVVRHQQDQDCPVRPTVPTGLKT
jgi:hypothetical protein